MKLILPTGYVEGPSSSFSQLLFGEKSSGAPDPEAGIRHATEALGPIAHMRQVHGDRVAYAEGAGLYEEYDALITDLPGLWLAVKTADCVPILITTPHAVAAVHCGWRGLAADLFPLTLEILMQEFRVEPEDISVAVGPHIETEHYAVGDELLEDFDASHFIQNDGQWHLDLFSVVKEQAREMDLLSENVWHANRGTYGDVGLNSHRRSKHTGHPEDTGRNLSLIRFTRR